jgi:hypothetical protein
MMTWYTTLHGATPTRKTFLRDLVPVGGEGVRSIFGVRAKPTDDDVNLNSNQRVSTMNYY